MSLLERAANDTGGRIWEHTEAGDAIEGVVISNSPFDGGKFEPARMLKVECTPIIEGGQKQDVPDTVSVLCGRSVLRRWVEEQRPAIGDTIAIFYKGKAQAKNAKPGDDPYNDYGFAIERAPTGLAAAAAADSSDW